MKQKNMSQHNLNKLTFNVRKVKAAIHQRRLRWWYELKPYWQRALRDSSTSLGPVEPDSCNKFKKKRRPTWAHAIIPLPQVRSSLKLPPDVIDLLDLMSPARANGFSREVCGHRHWFNTHTLSTALSITSCVTRFKVKPHSEVWVPKELLWRHLLWAECRDRDPKVKPAASWQPPGGWFRW